MQEKSQYQIDIHADNNFSVINRIVNILNRRRVRIKKMLCQEKETRFKGYATFHVFCTEQMCEKCVKQIAKVIEVSSISYKLIHI